MSLESQVRNEIRQIAGNAIAAIIDARQREQARKRAEACEEELVAVEMQRRLRFDPHFVPLRRFRIAIWRLRARKHASRCAAQRAAGHPLACLLCDEIERRKGHLA